MKRSGPRPQAASPAPAKAAKVAAKVASGAGEVRIIGGQWKRTRLPVAQRPGLRPTPDRVRETLFNWLGQDLSGWHCLDAFAGTGALGLEAASRGAAAVLLVEQDITKALAAADRGYVIENGRVALEGTAAELSANEHVKKAYLGI